MNSSGMPLIFSPDGKAASRGFRHSHSQVAMSGGIIMSTVKRGDGSILSYGI